MDHNDYDDVAEEEGACHPASFVRVNSVFTSSLRRKVGCTFMSATAPPGEAKLGQAERLVQSRQQEIINAWNDRFGR